MVMVNVLAFAPALTQVAEVATTLIVPTMSAPVLLVGAVYIMSPVPLAVIPMAALVLVQLSTAPATLLVKGILIDVAGQTATFATAVTTGWGLTVMVNVVAAPVHVAFVPVTLMVATIGTPVMLVAAVKPAMLPVPLATRLISVLLLVQLNVSPPRVLAVKLIAPIGAPEQTVMLLTAVTTGVG